MTIIPPGSSATIYSGFITPKAHLLSRGDIWDTQVGVMYSWGVELGWLPLSGKPPLHVGPSRPLSGADAFGSLWYDTNRKLLLVCDTAGIWLINRPGLEIGSEEWGKSFGSYIPGDYAMEDGQREVLDYARAWQRSASPLAIHQQRCEVFLTSPEVYDGVAEDERSDSEVGVFVGGTLDTAALDFGTTDVGLAPESYQWPINGGAQSTRYMRLVSPSDEGPRWLYVDVSMKRSDWAWMA